jgi:hypothetical protein
VVSILAAIIPLFAILCLCFLQKELDAWFSEHFHVSIPVNVHVNREILRFRLLEEQRTKRENDVLQVRLLTQNLEVEGAEEKSRSRLDSEHQEEPAQEDGLSGGTLGMPEAEEGKVKDEDKSSKFKDDEGNEHPLGVEGDLPQVVFESLLKADAETVA